jgi:hypothetical protein
MPHGLRRILPAARLALVGTALCAVALVVLHGFLARPAEHADAAAKRYASMAAAALEDFHVRNATYNADTFHLRGIAPALAGAHDLRVEGRADTYRVSVASSSPAGTDFTVTRAANGAVSHTCAPRSAGACSASRTW